MATRLGIRTSIHRLRHYSATELIAGGVDIRTVAGRLGHGGGGATTLKVYAAFVSEADQRAASTLLSRLPKPPVEIETGDTLRTTVEPAARGPYDAIAADLKAAIRCGVLRHGDQLPTVKDLGTRYGVAPSTVQRAFQLLRQDGVIDVARGRRATVKGCEGRSGQGLLQLSDLRKDVAMSDRSGIEWTEATWNPSTGCDRVSAGCDNCYALTLSKRLKAMGSVKYQTDGDPRTSGPGFGLALHPAALDVPRRWREPRLVFVNSMSDLFHARVPLRFVEQVVTTMRETPQHTYQVLTKRARRLRVLSQRIDWPPNVWVGTSVESAKELHRVHDLRQVNASIRFLSLEPLLGPLPDLDLTDIEWIIVGGESGPRARPMDPDWVRQVRDLAIEQRVPFFFKQWGGRTPKAGGHELDGRTWNEMPRRYGINAA